MSLGWTGCRILTRPFLLVRGGVWARDYHQHWALDYQCLSSTGTALLLASKQAWNNSDSSYCVYSSWADLFCVVQARINLIIMYVQFFLQTNGHTECFNQTVSRCLTKLVDDFQTDWDEKIDAVLMGYRASWQASTKHLSYCLLFHQQMCLPNDSEVLPSSFDQAWRRSWPILLALRLRDT